MVRQLSLEKFDFLDFGSSKGGCIRFATKKLGGCRGMGVEIDRTRARGLMKSGVSCILGDVTKIKLPKKSVSFVTISHLLEHLANTQEIKQTIKLAIQSAKDFIFIEGPTFDFDPYLEKLGFKFFWRDGCGHQNTLTTAQILQILREFRVPEVDMLVETPYIKDSNSQDILPITAPDKQLYYDPKIHPPKNKIHFNKKVFRSYIFFAWLSGRQPALLKSRAKFKWVKHETNR